VLQVHYDFTGDVSFTSFVDRATQHRTD